MWIKVIIGLIIPLIAVFMYKLYHELLEIDYLVVNVKRKEMCSDYLNKKNELIIEIAIECDFILMSNNSEYNVLYDCFKRSFGLEEFPSNATQYMDLYCLPENQLKHELNDECVREIFNEKGREFEEKFASDTDECMQKRYSAKEQEIELELEEEVNKRFQLNLQKELDLQIKRINQEHLEKYQQLNSEEDDDDDDPEGIWND